MCFQILLLIGGNINTFRFFVSINQKFITLLGKKIYFISFYINYNYAFYQILKYD